MFASVEREREGSVEPMQHAATRRCVDREVNRLLIPKSRIDSTSFSVPESYPSPV